MLPDLEDKCNLSILTLLYTQRHLLLALGGSYRFPEMGIPSAKICVRPVPSVFFFGCTTAQTYEAM